MTDSSLSADTAEVAILSKEQTAFRNVTEAGCSFSSSSNEEIIEHGKMSSSSKEESEIKPVLLLKKEEVNTAKNEDMI